MGIYFHYINDSKRQFFSIDPAGQDIKRYAVGRNIGSRLLHLLLLDDPKSKAGFEPHSFLGCWIGDRVFVGGDDCTPDFSLISREYEDIGQQLLEILAINAPEDLHQYGGRDWLANIGSGNAAIKLSDDARRSVLRYLRSVKHHFPSDDIDNLITVFRPQSVTPTDAGG